MGFKIFRCVIPIIQSIPHTVPNPIFSPVERKFTSKTTRDLSEPFKTSRDARRVLLRMSYDDEALGDIERSLSYLINQSPVEVYAIALDLLRDPRKPLPREIANGMERIARIAGRNSLRDPPLGVWTTGMHIKQDDYIRFTDYHLWCRIRLAQFLATADLIKKTGDEWIWYNTRCGVCPLTPTSIVVPTAALGAGKRPATWWVTYWEKVVALVGECPSEDPFTDGHIWDSTLRGLAKECPTCHETAAKEFPHFKDKLVNMITDIIDGVRMPFDDLPDLSKG